MKILYYSDAVNSANDYEAWCDSQRLHWYGGGTTHYNVSYNPATPITVQFYEGAVFRGSTIANQAGNRFNFSR